MKYHKIPVFVFTFISLFLSNTRLLLGDDREKAISIFENCIASRNSIQSMECILKIHRKLRNDTKTESYLEMMMDGDKIRAKKIEDNRPIYLFVNCYQPNSFGFLNLKPKILSQIKSEPGTQPKEETNKLNFAYLVLMNNDALKNDTPEERARFQFFDRTDNALPNPRWMGQNPDEYADLFGHNRNLDADFAVLKKGANDIQVLNELVDGKNLTKVFFTLPVRMRSDASSGNPPIVITQQYAFWFDLECGSTIRKVWSSLGRSALMTELSNEIQQDKRTGIWYPNKWKFVKKSGGYDLIEEYELEMISINQPIPPKNFDLPSAKELIPGTNVRWEMDSPPPAEGKLVWDGKKVVGLSEYNFGVATAGSWSSRRLFMICVNTAGISAILAIACYRAWRRQQRMC